WGVRLILSRLHSLGVRIWKLSFHPIGSTLLCSSPIIPRRPLPFRNGCVPRCFPLPCSWFFCLVAAKGRTAIKEAPTQRPAETVSWGLAAPWGQVARQQRLAAVLGTLPAELQATPVARRPLWGGVSLPAEV